MGTGSGVDPPGPPSDGRPTLPEWMGGIGIGQLQVLQLQAVEERKKLSPFVVGRSLKELVGEIESTTTEAGGDKYVLRVRDLTQAKKLLAMSQLFDGTPVSIQLHPFFNQRKCVISCREVINEKEEDLLYWLKEEGVIGVRRITRMENGVRVNTASLILTINGTTTPEHIRVGALRIKTRPYIPDPMLCYNCYDFGHTKQRCRHSPRCRNCSGSHDNQEECHVQAFCFRCKGQHGPFSRSCPLYVREKEITRLRFTKNISYSDAVKQIEAGGGSYANVTKAQSRLDNIRNEEEWIKRDELIRKLMENNAILSKRIEELENRKKYKKLCKMNKQLEAMQQKDTKNDAETEMDYDTSDHDEHAVTKATTQPDHVIGTSQKAGPPMASDSSTKVSAFTKPNPPSPKIKRQHTTTDISLPNKKIPDANKFSTPPQSQKAVQPRTQPKK